MSPFVANLFLNASVFAVSIRLYPIPYDYGRMTLIAAAAVGVYLLAGCVSGESIVSSMLARGAVLTLYPAVLLASGVARPSELMKITWLEGLNANGDT